MSLATASKQEVIQQFRQTEVDNGSPDVQIAMLTQRINMLTGHMRGHSKDYSSRRGLLRMVSKRRSLLDYVRKHDPNKYLDLISRLGIRK
ncbi:MAG: 30S ribosomal protein S15 [Planctomycetota bacterium]|jgi:small subunit ribosomal protein S15|nr:30S ribosomal protein S15 [Planctomycetota bacterium]